MTYAQAVKFMGTPGEVDMAYLLRLIWTFENMRHWAADDGLSKREADRLIKSGIHFLEFVGVQNLISDWDEVKVQK